MKLIYPEIDTVINFGEGTFPSVVIEHPALFYRFVEDLHRQANGESGTALLSSDNETVSIAGNLDLLTDFFSFEINRKTLLSKIISKLEKQALAPEFYDRSHHLLGEIEKLIYDLAFQNDLELEPGKLSITSLLKSSGLSLKEEYPTLAEKLLVYIDLMSSNNLASLFVLVNIRSVLDQTTMELFTDSCCRKQYNILLIDNKTYHRLSREERIIVDEDLCEI